jgi:hypothetical protein
LAAKYRLAVFDDFQVNIRSFIIPKLSNNVSGSLTLNFQLKISDQLLLKNLPDHTDEVGLKIKINNDT